MAKILWLGVLGVLLLAGTGCWHTCHRGAWCRRKDSPPGTAFVPPPPPAPLVQTVPANPALSPAPFPTVPGPPPGVRLSTPERPPSITPMPPAGPTQSKSQTQWQPSDARELPPRSDATRDAPRVELYAPEPIDREPGKDRVDLGVPQVEKDSKLPEQPLEQKPRVIGSYPPIPQFAVVKDNVKLFAGLRPPLDGLNWLQTNGVQTVMQIHLPGEDDSADRKQIEKRGMRYIAFEVSPATLTKEKADEFIKLIRETGKQSLFVYDVDGSLAGVMWYLYLRLGESYDDDVSQLRARLLGLQPNREGRHREMWVAVQKLLNENSR